jgi:bifunctional UDP-N-acetylglucosamine pyrophosphorylase / glucosamine-1-phosphate N-acetyltransferase
MSQPKPPCSDFSAIVLAAGKGTRMKSSLPKVLHPVLGRPMITWVTNSIERSGISHITLVLGNDREPFKNFLAEHPHFDVCIQKKQQGTADAVASASGIYKQAQRVSYNESEVLTKGGHGASCVLITASDTPAIDAAMLQNFIHGFCASNQPLGVIGMTLEDPRGYGRLVCNDQGQLLRCVEEKDADPDTRKIKLCNTGVVAAKVDFLFRALNQITPHNAQNEFYLTDLFSIASSEKTPAYVFETQSAHCFSGVNDRIQLAHIERTLLSDRLQQWALGGVSFRNLGSQYIEADVAIESDADIGANAVLTGKTHIHRNAKVGGLVSLHNAIVGAGATIASGVSLRDCQVRAGDYVATSQR